VAVKGTSKGVTTDGDGKYKIAASKGDVLLFSFIGFTAQSVTVGNQTLIDLSLKPDVSQLNEVVVTALGISRDKRSLSYTVQELKADKLTVARDANVGNALAGKIAGVQVLGQSGAKFGSPSIRVRGVNSLTGGDPLYVVDGTPVASIADVNMDDVENLSVLKGPSATALYGNRASGGVVVITTKRAKAGETTFNINQSTTLDMVAMLPKYQNIDWLNDANYNLNNNLHPSRKNTFYGYSINPYDVIFHKWFWHERDDVNFDIIKQYVDEYAALLARAIR
jgi:TonB-dependent SusC/RagA subfamily outer membrane receptor